MSVKDVIFSNTYELLRLEHPELCLPQFFNLCLQCRKMIENMTPERLIVFNAEVRLCGQVPFWNACAHYHRT